MNSSNLVMNGKFHFARRPETLFCRIALVALLALQAAVANAQDSPVLKINAEAENSEITVTPLRGGVYLLTGSGGYIGAFATKDAQFLVDAGISVSKEKLTRSLKSLSPGRITHVVNTHWHWDHADGNPWLPGGDITVVSPTK